MASDGKLKHYQHGLFNSREEHDACGVGFVANVHGERSAIVSKQPVYIFILLFTTPSSFYKHRIFIPDSRMINVYALNHPDNYPAR